MRNILRFLVGATIVLMSGQSVLATSIEERIIKATSPINPNYSDRFLITEVKISENRNEEYIKIKLNDSSYDSDRIFIVNVSREDGGVLKDVVSIAQVLISTDSDATLSLQKAVSMRHMGYKNDANVFTFRATDERGKYSLRVFDLTDCMKDYEEGVVCRLEGEKDGKLLYGAWKDGKRVREEVTSPSEELEGGEGGLDEGESIGEGEAVEGMVVAASGSARKTAVARASRIESGNEEVVEDLVEDESVVMEEEAEIEEELLVPAVSGVRFGWGWLFGVVGVIAFLWVLLVVYRRRKGSENKKAIAKIVADSKK